MEDAADVPAFKDFAPPATAAPADAQPSSTSPSPPSEAPLAATSPPVAAPPPPPAAASSGDTLAASPAPGRSGGAAPASPLARRLALAKGVDVGSLSGTGPGGRVIAADVEAASAVEATTRAAPALAAPAEVLGEADFEDIPHNNIRKITATRLTDSKRDIPHYYLTMECGIDELIRCGS